MTSATTAVLDFSGVDESSGRRINKKRQAEGDYLATILSVEDSPSKKDGVAQWLFVVQVGSGTYPYYCKHVENQLWKIRGLLKAAGLNVPTKKLKVDPTKAVKKQIGVTLADTEYNDKEQSEIDAVFPPSELEGDDVPETDEAEDEEVEEQEEDEETPAPKSKKKTKAAAPAAAVAVDDDELEELEVEDL